MTHDDTIESQFEASLAADLERVDDAAIDAVFDITETAMAVTGVVMSEVPIIRTLFALARAANNISTYLLGKKVVKFLTS
jgi:hypothetical protein